MAELVAGHSQDNEPLAGVTLVELVHLGVIPGGRTSERRDILNEDNFALQGGEIKRFSRQQFGREAVEFRSHSCTICSPFSETRSWTYSLQTLSASSLSFFSFLWVTVQELVFSCQDSSHPAACGLADLSAPKYRHINVKARIDKNGWLKTLNSKNRFTSWNGGRKSQVTRD